jgi:hypothetical protein
MLAQYIAIANSDCHAFDQTEFFNACGVLQERAWMTGLLVQIVMHAGTTYAEDLCEQLA